MRPLLSYALEGHGAPVLLLHGLGGDRHQALDMLPGECGGTRIAPEMPGHGATDLLPDEPVTFAAFSQATTDLLTHLAVQTKISRGPMPVVGVSMGAALALRLQADHPELVSQLILIRPSYGDQCPPPGMEPFETIGDLLIEYGTSEGRRRWLASANYANIQESAPAMAKSLLGQFDRDKAVERARVVRDMRKVLPLPNRDAYSKITVPTLVLGAPDDPVHDIAIARDVASWIPGADFEELPRKDVDATVHREALRAGVSRRLGLLE